MKNHGNFPKYRFGEERAPTPPNETPEQRIKRILNEMPDPIINDPKRLLAALMIAARTERSN